MVLTGATRAGRGPDDVHGRLEHPEAYPGLPRRRGAWRPLLLRRDDAFGDSRAWALIEAGRAHFVRRVVWRRGRDSPVSAGAMVTWGAEVRLETATRDRLTAELRALTLPPFLRVSTAGIDGAYYTLEVGEGLGQASARLHWWGSPPEAWEPLRRWHHATTELFESLLPGAPEPP